MLAAASIWSEAYRFKTGFSYGQTGQKGGKKWRTKHILKPRSQFWYFWVDGDYYLQSDSPCINTGDPGYIAEPNATDLDGKPRVISGQLTDGTVFEATDVIRVIDKAGKN